MKNTRGSSGSRDGRYSRQPGSARDGSTSWRSARSTRASSPSLATQRTVSTNAMTLRAPANRVRQRSERFDLDRDLVAVLEQTLRVTEDADPGGSPGEDEVAGLKCRRLRDVGDDLVHAEDEVRRRGVLQHPAAHDRPDPEVVRSPHLRGGDR